METNLQHEDLLIKLRAKLNEEKIKLWEPPYVAPDDDSSNQSIKDLAARYSVVLGLDPETILNALHELQVHSLDRSKANAEFKETGFATFRVKATVPGEKPRVFKIQKKLDVMGSEMIGAVAEEIGVAETRVKLIFNGTVVKPSPSLEEQGLKNGALIMALIMAETPEEVKKEDTMYMEMKQTRDDATLLSECIEGLAGEEYMKLEDQSGKTVELPPAEKKSLLVGLALHEKGRAEAKVKQYPLALVLLLEADRQLSECRSSILKTVDNWAVLQLDISWCYLCLQSLQCASDAAARLAKAEQAFIASYGRDGERLVAVKGTAANERVLFMRLYLLQGIVAYHQNKREEAKRLLDKAEEEINALRVDSGAVSQLMELGWSLGAARAGLRAAGGELTQAHHYLEDAQGRRDKHRREHDEQRVRNALGVCADGSAVRQQLVAALVEMGHGRRRATRALRLSNNHAADAVRILQEQPHLVVQSDDDSFDEEESDSLSSRESLAEPDEKLVAELVGMGYPEEEAKLALSHARNHISGAVDILVAGCAHVPNESENGAANSSAPSTSTGAPDRKLKRQRKRSSAKKRKEREAALNRLTSSIKSGAEEYLDTSLSEEEDFLAQYKSLL